ncbi:RND transporter [Pseudomonas monteilii]|uniref:RND transporter n=2 Tax=Pseudomonas monteilii TaxID=76759 RepID=A0AAE6V2W9_9PSED|nr:RND transporter [Pseudomonas monteilii]
MSMPIIAPRRWLPRFIPAVCMLLSACSAVGPDYQLPQLPAGLSQKPQVEFEASDELIYESQELPSDWWRLYAAPALDDLVAEAIAHNTDLRVAIANIEVSEAALRGVQSQGSIQTHVATPEGAPAIAWTQSSNKGLSPAGEAHGQYDISLGISYEVDVAGRLRRTLEMSTASLQATAAARDLARTIVVARVVRAYGKICSLGERKAVAQQSVALQQQSLTLLQRGATAGIYSSLDLSRARALLAQLRAEIPLQEAQRKSSLYELAVLLGRRPENFPTQLQECVTPPQLTRPIPVGDGMTLLRRRPDVRAAERELAAATAKIGVETAELYPSISLGAGLGTTARMGTDALANAAIHYSLGTVISWTLPNRQLAHARIDAAGAEERIALARFDAVVLKALQETEDALATYAGHLDWYRDLEVAREESRKSLDIVHRRGIGGTVSTLDRLDAERTLAATESALVAARGQLADDRVQIFLALGGGW